MESTEVIIARLVLGYLKGEKCISAYKEFIRTSTHLRDDMSVTKSKYLPTRFTGLTLEDILIEYFEISKIVQGSLESTNYYSECHSKTCLVQQLLYLLSKTVSSRTSTPCPRSPLDSNLDDTSLSHVDHISDVETTPAHTLPGNVRCTSEDSYFHKTARKKPHLKLDKSTTEANFPCTDKEDISEVLAQTLLENKEFHEKIAQTINKVAEKQFRVSSELDKTIKTVVRETEEDPIFDKILDEIIGSTSIIDNNGLETSSTSSSIAKNFNENVDDRSKRTNKHSNLTNEYVPNYRSYIDSQKVEEQNNEAIRSIIANSKLTPNKHTDEHEQQESSEVIVFDGSLDKYLIANTCNTNTQTQPMQQPLYFNTAGGLVMVPSGITKVTGNMQVDSKQFYLVNQQPPLNWNAPIIKTPSIITEQDILAMPTVIVNEESQKPVVEAPTLKSVSKPLSQKIVPRPVIEVPNIEEYLRVRDAIESHQKGLKKVMYPKTKNRKLSEPAENCKTSETVPVTTENINLENNTKSFPEELCKDQDDPPIESKMSMVSLEPKATKPQVVESQAGTPSLSEPPQKVTPKSSSHVRNLDFSTPPKITSTHKKTLKSKQSTQTPQFVQKKQAVKTLFKPIDSESINQDDNLKESVHAKEDPKNKINKPASTWDADLRAVIQPVEEVKSRTPKRKRKTPPQKSKKKVKKAAKGVAHRLNTTEHDAALLEAALQTPCKISKEHCKSANNNVIDTIKPEAHGVLEDVCVPSESEFKKSTSRRNSFAVKIEKSKAETKIKDKCKQKTKENRKDNTSKMVFSPSKLNASKRNVVVTENLASNLADALTDLPIGDTKFVTPEMTKENMHYPIKANRNITSILETPLKNEFIPKTPGLLTPNNPGMDMNLSMCSNGFTPFTKMLEANLKGIDINSLPTPSIPITPSFPPFTPTIDLISPYSNRPTDYSTSSSYYQPSDSEQNKSLEANLIELEKKPITVLSNVIVKEEIISSGNGNSKEVNKLIVKEQVVPSSESNLANGPNKNDQNKSTRATTVREHLSIFNKNVIGKKNLNLMNRNVSFSSSSSDDSTSDSSGNEDTWNGEQSNETVIFKKKPVEIPTRTYSLRNRSISINNKQETIKNETQLNESKISRIHSNKDTMINPKPTSKVNSKQYKESKVVAKPEEVSKEVKEIEITTNIRKNSAEITSFKQNVLNELEEKRLRTINKFKNVEQTSSDISTTKPVRQAKFIKIKPIPNVTNTRRKPRKSTSPKKTCRKTTANVCSRTVNKKKDASQNSLRARSGDHSDKSTDKTDKSASDVEAQNLIEGLKERGIHLMHNKPSPMKKINGASNESKVDVEKTKHVDNVDSKDNLDHNEDDISRIISAETTNSELSTSQLESELRETYDDQVFEEHEHVVFDESKEITKTFEDYDTKVLKKTFIGKVFVEEIDAEIDVPLIVSPFYTLLDFPSTLDLKPESIIKNSKAVEKPVINKNQCLIRDISNPLVSDAILKSDDDLMNYAIIGSGNEGTPERSESPKRTKKRKQRNEENSHTEKKCKTLLKKINVDSFLNNIHGGS